MRSRCSVFRHVSAQFRFVAAHVLLGAGLLFLAAQSQADDAKTYLRWDDVKCSDAQSADCYNEAYCHIYFKTKGPDSRESIQTCEDLRKQFGGYHSTLNDYSRYRLKMGKKPSTVVVSIHGLWGDASQFTSALARTNGVISESEPNLIELTLPGHMKVHLDSDELKAVKANKPFATFDRWLAALDETLELARHIGQKTIVIGQSTGGLLAVIAALKHPDKVDEIVLVEPALQVRPLVDFGACLSASVPDLMIDVLGALVGVSVPSGVSVKMGCEVQKLAQLFFPRQFIVYPATPRSGPHKKEDFSIYERVASQVRIPVLMMNNENDKIVTAEASRRFFNGLRTAKKYVSLNQDGKMPHGEVTFREPERIADLITKFSFENLPERTIGKIYVYRAYERVNRLSSGPCSYIDSFDECLKKAKERVDEAHAALENLRPAFLAIIKDEAEFARFSEVLAANHQAWIRITERASSAGLKNGHEFYEWFKANPDEETPRAIEGEKYIYAILKRLEQSI